MKTHRELDSWKLGVDLADLGYRVTRNFPHDERFGLTSQLRRAAVSVPTNIAEGAARGTTKDYRRLLFIARGSFSELETLVIVASRVGMLYEDQKRELLTARNRAAQTLQGMIRSLKS